MAALRTGRMVSMPLLAFFGAALGADCFIALFFVHLALLALSYTLQSNRSGLRKFQALMSDG